MDRKDGRAAAAPVAHLPRAGDFLLWPPTIQPWGYRIVDRLFAHRVVPRGEASAARAPWPRGTEIAPRYRVGGSEFGVEEFLDRNFIVGLLVVQDGRILLERYGLGLGEGDRWSTMSTVKSLTALLVGAALRDGAIASVEAPVTRFLPEMAGTAYEGVTLAHLMGMSSGVGWDETYADAGSDVNRYSRSLADKVPGGVLRIMAGLTRRHPPGTVFNYNSGDTFLLGAALTRAVGRPLADYLSERIWRPASMEFDAFYTLESEAGQEIAGSRAGMALRDFGRLACLVLKEGAIPGVGRVWPEGWIDAVATPRFAVDRPNAPGITSYGWCWWLGEEGRRMSALGFAGQRVDVFRAERLAVVTLGAFPQAPHVAPEVEVAHRREVAAFTEAVRQMLSGTMG
jgi:CubicO group peptidase (beta-lactamase class C family)